MKRILVSACAALALTAGVALATEQDEADGKNCPQDKAVKAGTIEATVKTVGFIAAARWGEGTLTLNDGSEHKFHAAGGKLLEAGAAEVEFTASVYDLDKLEDFAGDYGAITTNLVIIKGLGGAGVLSNEHCVYIEIDETDSTGLKVNAPAPGAVQISFED